MAGIVPRDALFATNTSSISITALAAVVSEPQRFLGMHFFNPVPMMALVELIRGLQTADEAMTRAEAFAKRVGKTPIVVKNSPGFVVNRILCPMLNEAVFALQEGLATAQAIDDGIVDDPATMGRYHHQIRGDAERLTTLVDDLFELSRIHSGALRLDRRRVPLADVVDDALTGAQAVAHLKGVELDVRTGELPAVEIAPVELGRVLHNLLDNAIRHTPAGGRVVVTTEVGGGEATLSVLDQCGGIPEPDLGRVFDVAFRGDTARSKDGRGGGLGLAIARGLVEAHDGRIDVANAHAGCRFTVHLPVT